VAELMAPQTGQYFLGIATELGRYGCFVRTKTVLTPGSALDLKITHDGQEFCALGTVVYCVPERGMGIAFGSSSPAAELILSGWLNQLTR
jgi:hypothetical protein